MKKMPILIYSVAIALILVSCDSGGNKALSLPSSAVAYTLSVVRNLEDGGSIFVNTSTTANPGPSTRNAGAVITVRALPASGYTFQNWQATSGNFPLPTFVGGSVTTEAVTFRMNGNVFMRANFKQNGSGPVINPPEGNNYTLNISRDPAVGGNVRINDVNINPAETLFFGAGATVNLTAMAINGYTFQNWSVTGGSVEDENSANTTITLNSNAIVTANFHQPPTYTLNVNINPDHGGAISRDPDKANYNPGETVTITAIAYGGWNFQNWTGANVAGANSASATITMNSNANVTANYQSTGNGGGNGGGSVTTYPFPNPLPHYNNGVTMTAGGKNIELISVKVNHNHISPKGAGDAWPQNGRSEIPVAMFDVNGSVSITVDVPNSSGALVRPRSHNISPSVSGNRISFNIPGPGQYSVEWNNTPETPYNALLIFANPVENFSGRTLGPGEHGGQTVNGGETLVLEAGAVVRGRIFMNSNSKLVGRGIIDGSNLLNWNLIGNNATLPIETYNGNNIEINGITIFDPNGWCVQVQESSNVRIKNLKIISSRANSDGISIQSSNDVHIEDSFIRSWDDSIVVKNYGSNSYGITAKNCILWTDLAQCMEIGYETNKGRRGGPTIQNVTFENITVLHAMHRPPISIHNGDNAAISNITFRNIVVENYQCGASLLGGPSDGLNYLIDFNNIAGGWTSVSARGSISNCRVENVIVLDGREPSARFYSLQGGSISNITIKDIYVNGSKRGQFGKVSSASINWQ